MTATVTCNNLQRLALASPLLLDFAHQTDITKSSEVLHPSRLPYHMEQPTDNLPPLRRRNTIATPLPVPILPNSVNDKSLRTASSLPNGVDFSLPPPDLELVDLKPSAASYTSLKDLLPSSPAAVSSPSIAASSGHSAYEISIRNRLVKQAAWAYLQPMASSPESSGHHFLHRAWLQLSARNPFSCCLQFLSLLASVFDRILRSIRIRLAR